MDKAIPTSISTQKKFERMSDGENRPWGSFHNLAKGGNWHIKIIQIEAAKRLSLQSHEKREEQMMLLDGDASLQLDDVVMTMAPGVIYKIDVGMKHRLSSDNGGKVIEIAYGNFDEQDIVRFEDDFGRTA